MTTVEDILKSEGLVDAKPYGVTAIICNHTNGVVDQKITITEGAASAPEQVFKYQWICDAVISALNGNNEEGTGGVFREMGENFQEVMDQAIESGAIDIDDGGIAMREFNKARGRGQGKPRKN